MTDGLITSAYVSGWPVKFLSTPKPIHADALLLSDVQAARMCGISRSVLHRLRAAHKWPPASVRLGRAVRYRRDEVERWVAAGCPDAATWRAMQSQNCKLKVRA